MLPAIGDQLVHTAGTFYVVLLSGPHLLAMQICSCDLLADHEPFSQVLQ